MDTAATITNVILMHHLTAFGENNHDEIMKDYDEESEILTLDGSIKGLKAIGAFFTQMFVMIPKGCFFEMKKLSVTDHVAHIIWASKSDVVSIPFGTDTFIIEDGKIKVHTVAFTAL